MPTLPDRPSLEHLRNQAKQFLRAYQAQEPDAQRRLRHTYPKLAGKTLRRRDALNVIAAEHRFPSWAELKQKIERDQQGIRSPVEQMHDAALDGDIDTMRRLLATGEPAMCSPMNWGHKPPLCYAIEGGDADCVALLLEEGAPITEWEYDAQEHARQHADPQILEMLGRRHVLGKDLVKLIDADDEDGALAMLRDTPQLANAFHDNPYQPGPLMLAAKHDHKRLAKTLLDLGARVNSHFNNSNRGAITYADVHHHHDIAQMLREAGAKPTPINNYHYAAELGDLQQVKRCLAEGMDVNEIDDCRHHVLPGVIYQKQQAMLDYLLGRGADINLARGWEDYCWWFNDIRAGDTELIKLLLRIGLDVHLPDGRGATSLQVAEASGQDAIAALLRDAGATH